jgi:murein DD-endopeptidase MepM/ murein hydrolase activator NlpD
VVGQNGQTMSRTAMREYLRENVPVWQEIDDSYIARYQALRNSLIDFYLGSGSVDVEQVGISQRFGVPEESTADLYSYHTGIDAVNAPLTELLAAWSGRVERSDWSDSIGNAIDVMAGYSFEGEFMSAGFSFGVAHLADRNATLGQSVASNTLIGRSGNTGTLVRGQNDGYHNHFTIFNSDYGHNRFLSDILGFIDSSGWRNSDGTPWTYPHQPFDRRFYDPRRAYQQWFRN